jgi:hypothetical protein
MTEVMWDCITAYAECLQCKFHHKLISGNIPPKCPYGKKQYLRILWLPEEGAEG